MLEHIISVVANLITTVIDKSGYLGVGFLMAIDSANIPMPSEIIMPFSGYLVTTGRFVFWLAVTAGTLGSTIGSLFSYWLGAKGGRPFVKKYGQWVMVSKKDLERADRLFARFGNLIALISRVVPVVRTFISLPAGITRMPIWTFTIYTLIGSFVWTWFLVYVGVKVGENYEIIREKFHGIEYVVLGLLVLGFVVWVVHFVKEQREIRQEQKAQGLRK